MTGRDSDPDADDVGNADAADDTDDTDTPDTDAPDTDSPTLDAVIRAGVAIYNAGEYHAAHDAWEDRWLDLESETPEERLLHGLIQFTAVVHHARAHNWSGATGLAESADGYLDGLADTEGARGVNVATVRRWLRAFRADPERIERRSPPALRVDGEIVEAGVLTLSEAAVAAGVVAEEYGFDETVVADAGRFARERSDPDSSKEATFLRDVVGDPHHRPLVFRRLTNLVERRRRKEADVSGLFESREE